MRKALLIAFALLCASTLGAQVIVGIYHVGVLDYAGYPDSVVGSPATTTGRVYFSTTDNLLHCKTSTGASCLANSSGTPTLTVASGAQALGTSAISSGACATVVTASATGALTTDNIAADFNADPTGVTGYQASSNGMLTIIKYPTANTVNFLVCNNTLNSITPGAITLNWRVVR